MRRTAATPAEARAATRARSWWHDGVLYQIYPRSFQDSDGDGIGDLRGLVERLDHLAWLGVDGIWLNPTMPSPNADWGYDVADYTGVHPDLGAPSDLEALVAAAGERGIRVLLDLVPNHTSDQHPWFQDARSSRDSLHRDFYVWADPGPNGAPPNNWLSAFGGAAWTLDVATGQCFLHNFLPSQPDLNWWKEEVSEAFDDVLRFWFARGVAGFRIDVAHAIVKDRELRDNPPADDTDHPQVREHGQRRVYSMNRPELHDVLRRWRRVSAEQEGEERILVGESYVLSVDELSPFYGDAEDELHMAFNFIFVHAGFEAGELRAVVEETEAVLPVHAWPVWTGSNHDAGRLTRRWCDGEEARARCALLMLLTLRGTPFLYYGDEIAMAEPVVPPERWRDPVGRTSGDPARNRDGCRTPMQWSAEPGAGFTAAGAEPWLPLGDHAARNVEAARADPRSVLHLVRDLIAVRREHADLRSGAYASLPAPEGAWAWRRGERFAVALNLSGTEAAIEGLAGRVRLSTGRDRDGEAVEGGLVLGPWSGALVELR